MDNFLGGTFFFFHEGRTLSVNFTRGRWQEKVTGNVRTSVHVWKQIYFACVELKSLTAPLSCAKSWQFLFFKFIGWFVSAYFLRARCSPHSAWWFYRKMQCVERGPDVAHTVHWFMSGFLPISIWLMCMSENQQASFFSCMTFTVNRGHSLFLFYDLMLVLIIMFEVNSILRWKINQSENTR